MSGLITSHRIQLDSDRAFDFSKYLEVDRMRRTAAEGLWDQQLHTAFGLRAD